MAAKRLKRLRDPIQLGKLIVDIATGQVEDSETDASIPIAVPNRKKASPGRGSDTADRPARKPKPIRS